MLLLTRVFRTQSNVKRRMTSTNRNMRIYVYPYGVIHVFYSIKNAICRVIIAFIVVIILFLLLFSPSTNADFFPPPPPEMGLKACKSNAIGHRNNEK